MANQAKAHETSVTIVQLAIAELDSGAEIHVSVRLSCTDFCDLRGRAIKIVAADGKSEEVLLTTFNGAENSTDDFVLKVPDVPGSYAWTAMFPEQESGGIPHLEGSAPFSFVFKPHGISVAVWDIPLPVVVGAAFTVKIGVRCSANCRLAGKTIDIHDHEGAKIATATLGALPWPGTDALYWADVELEAPKAEGYNQRTVKFAEADLERPHESASAGFGFLTAGPPEHRVSVEVVDQATDAPIVNADVILHPYRAYSDEQGVATIRVPKGHYEVYISESGKQTFRKPLDVADDATVKAVLLAIPPDLPMS
ncbi:MAG: carboxypeptidase-like regulatory domain-containing protein [Spirochaetota bacterium]